MKYVYAFCEGKTSIYECKQLRCVICPFCELSSCDVKLYIARSQNYFWCQACNARSIVGSIERINNTRAICENPAIDIDGDVFMCELVFIAALANPFLSSFASEKVLDTRVVVDFLHSAQKYANKQKLTLDSLSDNQTFLAQNEFVSKYKLRGALLTKRNKLYIPVNSYDIYRPKVPYPSNMTFHYTDFLELNISQSGMFMLFDSIDAAWYKK